MSSVVTATAVGWIEGSHTAEISWFPPEPAIRTQPVAELTASIGAQAIEDMPAFGVMLHLLAAVALGLASSIFGVLVLLGVLAAGNVVGSLALAGLACSAAWIVRLVRVALRS